MKYYVPRIIGKTIQALLTSIFRVHERKQISIWLILRNFADSLQDNQNNAVYRKFSVFK